MILHVLVHPQLIHFYYILSRSVLSYLNLNHSYFYYQLLSVQKYS